MPDGREAAAEVPPSLPNALAGITWAAAAPVAPTAVVLKKPRRDTSEKVDLEGLLEKVGCRAASQ